MSKFVPIISIYSLSLFNGNICIVLKSSRTVTVGAVLTGAVGVAGEDLGGGGGGGRRGRRGDGGRAGGGRRHAGVHVIILGRAHRMTLQVERRGRCDGHGATATEVISRPPCSPLPPRAAPPQVPAG